MPTKDATREYVKHETGDKITKILDLITQRNLDNGSLGSCHRYEIIEIAVDRLWEDLNASNKPVKKRTR